MCVCRPLFYIVRVAAELEQSFHVQWFTTHKSVHYMHLTNEPMESDTLKITENVSIRL